MESKNPIKHDVRFLQVLLTTVLLSVILNPVSAAVDPTDGWTQTSYNYSIQTPWDLSQSDRYSYVNGEHRFWIYPNDNCHYQGCGTGPRSELRMQNNYLTGRHQFEGEVYITSGTHGTDIMQVFGGVSYSTSFMMKVTNSNGGTLKRYNNETLMTNAYGKWIKVNVQHDAINGIGKIYVYLDDNLVGIFDDRGYKTHYFKCGVYNISGSQSETRWRNVKYWKDGPVGGNGGGISNGTYKIEARHSGRAMMVEGASTANNANVSQYTYGGSTTNDEWIVTDIGGGYHSIINEHSGKALSIDGGGTARGLNAKQHDYNGWTHQRYELEDMGGGYYRMKNARGFCIDVEGAGTANGDNIIQWDCSSGHNQQWLFTKIGTGARKNVHEFSDDETEVRKTMQEISENGTANFNIYPNPSQKDQINISYELAREDHVRLSVCNLNGQMIAELVDEYQGGGSYSLPWRISDLPSGIYIARLVKGDDMKIIKFVVNE